MDQQVIQKLTDEIESMKKDIALLLRSRVHNNMTTDTRYNIVTSVVDSINEEQLAVANPFIKINYRGKVFQVPTTNYVISGSGAPTKYAPKGTLYCKIDATTTTTRLYINTDGGTTWASFTASA